MHNQIISDFIKSEFPIKRTRTTNKKWTKAIVVPEGYLRKDRKSYPTKDKLSKALIAADIVQIVMNVFGCDEKFATQLTLSYFRSIRI
jgi:hypothetical protein